MKQLYYLLFSCFLPLLGFAQQAPNDCANALRLCTDSPVNSTNIGTTTECGANSADGDCTATGIWCFKPTNTSWYYFVTDADGGDVKIDIYNFNTSNVQLQTLVVLAGTPCDASTYSMVACNNMMTPINATDTLHLIQTGLSPNTTYYLAVDGYESNTDTTEYNYTLALSGSGAGSCCVNPPSITQFGTIIPADCGVASGSATVQVNGGISPYQYLWSTNPAQTTATASNLRGGDYSVTVLNADGTCPVSQTVTIASIVSFGLTGSVVAANCGTATGTAIVEIINPSGTYTYSWYGSNPDIPIDRDSILNNVMAGTYSVVVRSTADTTCFRTTIFQITELGNPIILDSIVTAPACGDSTGSATVRVIGGQAPYRFSWEVWNNAGVVISTDSIATDLAAGTYWVNVSNNNGACTARKLVIVGAQGSPIVWGFDTKAANCNGKNGWADPIVSLGTPPYLYSWAAANAPNTIISRDSILKIGLVGGQYYLTVTNADTTCPYVTGIYINEPPQIVGFQTLDAGCDPTRGVAAVQVNLGTRPYTYLWTAQGRPNDTLSVDSFATALPAGTYNVIVRDSYNNCDVLGTVRVKNAEPLSPVFPFVFPSECDNNGGRAYIELFDGTRPYRIEWFDENNQIISRDTFINRLVPGNYSITVRDTNNCSFSHNFQIGGTVPPIARIAYQIDSVRYYSDTVYLNIGDSLRLIADTDSTHNLIWSPVKELSCAECMSPIARPVETTQYVLAVTDSISCTRYDTITVIVRDSESGFWMPNAFTPNEDEVNDVIFPNGMNIDNVVYWRVYDRWGEKIYEVNDFDTNDKTVGWDGTYRSRALEANVYTYTAEVVFKNKKKQFYKGSFTLIR